MTIAEVISIACKHWNISEQELTGNYGEKTIVSKRQLTIVACRDLLGCSYKEIQVAFKKKSLKSVHHSIVTGKQAIKTYPTGDGHEYKRLADKIKINVETT